MKKLGRRHGKEIFLYQGAKIYVDERESGYMASCKITRQHGFFNVVCYATSVEQSVLGCYKKLAIDLWDLCREA